MQLIWCTDIHLDHCSRDEQFQFFQILENTEADGIAITGDISSGKQIIDDLRFVASSQSKPIYFVLGNHDYYHSSFSQVNQKLFELCKENNNLHWLSQSDPLLLSASIALIGHRGWGDAQNGDFQNTPIRLTDHRLIQDLTGYHRIELQQKLQQLGIEAAQFLAQQLEQVTQNDNIKQIWILTHVPPFVESAWHNGQIGHWHWHSDFTCKAVGDLLLDTAKKHPDINFTVLCGHGHSYGEAHMLSNLLVRTGDAQYGNPKIVDVIEISE